MHTNRTYRRLVQAAVVFIVLVPSILRAEGPDEVTQLRSEVAALRAQVSSLEARLAALETALAAPPAAPAAALEIEEPSLFQRLADRAHEVADPDSTAWFVTANWDRVRPGMSPEEVIAILGTPTYDEPSLNRRVDRVFTYQARKGDTHERVVGKIRFERGKVVSIDQPSL